MSYVPDERLAETRAARRFALGLMVCLGLAVVLAVVQVWLDFGPWRALLPHATCYRFNNWVIWPIAVADAQIAMTFFLTPAGIIWLLFRKKAPLPGLSWLMATNYLACGLTHVFDVWTVWYPTYYMAMVVRWMTVISGWVTVVALFRVVRAVPTLMGLAADVETALLGVAARMRRLENDKADAMEDFARLVGRLKPKEADVA